MRRVMTPEQAIRDIFNGGYHGKRLTPDALDALALSQPVLVRGNVEFRPIPGGLPKTEEEMTVTVGCICPWCSPDRNSTARGGWVWDTVAYSKEDGRAWVVHCPELHHWPMRRPFENGLEQAFIELSSAA